MATYGDAIGGLATGAGVPTGWTNRWNAGATYTVSTDVDAPGGKKLNVSTTTAARRFLSYDAINGDADRATSEVLALIRINDTVEASATHGGVGIRGHGSSGSETVSAVSYGTPVGSVSKFLKFSKYVAGAFTSADTAWSWVTGDAFWFKVSVTGTTLTANVYAEADLNGTSLVSLSETVAASNASNYVGIFSFTTNSDFDFLWFSVGTNGDSAPVPGADSTAPTLTSPTGTQTSSTTATGTVSTNEANGTLDAVATTSATTPSAAQIQAGQDHTGAAAAATDLNNTVTTTGSQSVAFTGLTASTTYYVHYVHEDAAANVSTAVSSASFTTTATATKGVQLSLKQADGTTAAASLTGLYYHVWDALNPGGASDADGSTESTDVSGVLEININSFTTALAGEVFLFVYDLDGTEDKDSVCFAGRVPVVDIS